MRSILVFVTLLATALPATAATLEVGAGKLYTTIAAAAAVARDGDTVYIFPGTYAAGAQFAANNLTIAAAPGSKRGSVIVSRGVVGAKGLFVIRGDNITVDNIRFRYAKVRDGNGAGIRADGMNLTVRNSTFDRNEMGILLTPRVAGSVDRIENSRFDYTWSQATGRIGHSVYATGNVGELVVSSSTFLRTTTGHYIKSRAGVTIVSGNTIDDTNGSASYLIELSEGGAGTISGNRLTKGANASNCCVAVSYGAEMSKGGVFQNTPGPVLIENNTFTNKRGSTVRFVQNSSTPANPVTLTGNILIASAGTIVPLGGPGTVNSVAQDELLALTGDALFGLQDAFEASAADGPVAFALAGPAAIPAPGGLALAGLGLAALAWGRR